MMNNPFFISHIPDKAEYVRRSEFTGQISDVQEFLDHVQVVDVRWDSTPVREPSPEIAKLFRIKDMQLSKVEGDVLCGITIFKMSVDKKDEGQNPDFYDWFLRGLHYRVEQFKTIDYKRQKLQVYVADDVWDILHKEGILQANHVNFIRMATSSDKTYFGQVWRNLVHTELEYPYTYIDDTDVGFVPEAREGFPDIHIEPRLKLLQDTGCNMYFSVGRRTPVYFETKRKMLHQISSFKTGELSTVRGRTSFLTEDVLLSFSRMYERTDFLCRVYNPLNETWTTITVVPEPQLENFHIGNPVPYCWRQLRNCYHIINLAIDFLETKSPLYYFNRMLDQFEAEGNIVLRKRLR